MCDDFDHMHPLLLYYPYQISPHHDHPTYKIIHQL